MQNNCILYFLYIVYYTYILFLLEHTYSSPLIFPPTQEITHTPGSKLWLLCNGPYPVIWRFHSVTDRPLGDVSKHIDSMRNSDSMLYEDYSVNINKNNMNTILLSKHYVLYEINVLRAFQVTVQKDIT